jgi:hypothetical protein
MHFIFKQGVNDVTYFCNFIILFEGNKMTFVKYFF